jgi:hypothetical protein
VQTKFFTLVTLKQILCQLVGNIVGNTDIEKTSRSMQIIFHTIIQILQQDKDNHKQSKQGQLYTTAMHEFQTEFFASIVERSHPMDPELIKPYHREIIDLFNADSFFQVSMLNLKQW